MKDTFRLVVVLLALASSIGAAQSGEQALLSYSYSGAGRPGSSGREFMQAMEHREVQRLLLDVASEPRDAAFVEAALRGTGITPEALQALRLIRLQGRTFSLAFALLTRADLDTIRAAAEVQGKHLAEAMLLRRNEIRAVLERNRQPEVDWTAVAFFVVGCVSLDWDGLNLMEKRGYLAVGSGERFLPQARQTEGGGSIRGLYWGSHNYHAAVAVTSFGDHASVPRNALPDVLWRLSMREPGAPASLTSALVSAVDELVRRRAGVMMLALRDKARSSEELRLEAGLTKEETAKLLEFLLQLRYVRNVDGRFAAIIPVLTDRDKEMVTQIRRLGRDVMTRWLESHVAELTRQLAGLTPVRNGVPLPESFYWVWHYIFGIANRELVAAGLFADPYASDRVFQGFIPAVYPLRVAQGGF